MSLRLLSTLAVTTVLTLPTFSVSAQTPVNTDRFAAIAYSKNTKNQGVGYNYSTRQAAENKALQECEAYSKTKDCQVVMWFKNACGAIAISTDGAYGSAWGDNRLIVERKALEACSDYGLGCRLRRWICTGTKTI